MSDMTDYEKAWQISHDCYMPDTGFTRDDLYDSAIEMAQWKEQQIIEKACKWLEKHVEDFMPPTNSLHDYNTGELIHFFKKAMDE